MQKHPVNNGRFTIFDWCRISSINCMISQILWTSPKLSWPPTPRQGHDTGITSYIYTDSKWFVPSLNKNICIKMVGVPFQSFLKVNQTKFVNLCNQKKNCFSLQRFSPQPNLQHKNTQPSLNNNHHSPPPHAGDVGTQFQRASPPVILQQKKVWPKYAQSWYHLWKLTWNRKIIQLNREIIFQTCIFWGSMFNFQGCTNSSRSCCCVHRLCCHLLFSHCWGMYGTEFVPPGRENG